MAEAAVVRPDNVFPIRKEVKVEQPLILRPTTGNPRKLEGLRQAFPGIAMEITEGGPENEKQLEIEIAKGKVLYGRGYIEQELWKAAGEHTGRGPAKIVYIAGDTRVGPLQMNEDGVADTQSRWKPETVEEIREVFVRMLDAATHPDAGYAIPHYMIRSGSGILVEDPQKKSQDLHSTYYTTTLTLNPIMVDHFSTPEGFAKYIEACNEFHESELYGEVGEKQTSREKPTLLGVASGLELAVLARIGAITEVNGIKAGEPTFRENMQDALYTALVGISPNLLKQVDPEAPERLKNWAWLNKVTDYAMEGIRNSQTAERTEEQAVA